MSDVVPQRHQIKAELKRSLGGYLLSCRWYGEKSRPIVELEWTSTGEIQLGAVWLFMGIVSIQQAGHVVVEYALPVVLDSDAQAQDPICTFGPAQDSNHIYDAVEHEAFHRWLVAMLFKESNFSPDSLGVTWTPTVATAELAQLGLQTPVRVSSAEQSNSSLIIGNSVIIKLFRRLRAGINPDVEVGRFLTNAGHFKNVPATLGELRVVLLGGEASLGVAQQFVESIGDGWEYSRSRLASLVRSGSIDEGDLGSWLAEAHGLGSTTADLHLALAENTQDIDFSPAAVTASDVTSWTGDLEARLKAVLNRLEQPHVADVLDPTLLTAVKNITTRLSDVASNFGLLADCSKTRVHGDYHLGQILRTSDGRWIILDFEGEPARTIEERRAKSSPLSDVAGMLRSFNYARAITERDLDSEGSAEFGRWEKETREAFLNGYFAVAQPGFARFLPKAADDARQALRAWELHKALYEVLYELDNRPNWAWLPLTATLKLA